MFESAEKLGLKVVRLWAFNDGDGWNALQPRIGQINEHVFRCRPLLPWHWSSHCMPHDRRARAVLSLLLLTQSDHERHALTRVL